LSQELQDKFWIYRPILAGKCTIEGVNSGEVSIEQVLELNALLDMSTAYEQYQSHVQEQKSKTKK